MYPCCYILPSKATCPGPVLTAKFGAFDSPIRVMAVLTYVKILQVGASTSFVIEIGIPFITETQCLKHLCSGAFQFLRSLTNIFSFIVNVFHPANS